MRGLLRKPVILTGVEILKHRHPGVLHSGLITLPHVQSRWDGQGVCAQGPHSRQQDRGQLIRLLALVLALLLCRGREH